MNPTSNQNDDSVYAAVKNGHLQIVLQFLELGIDVNMVNPRTQLNLLTVACLNKHHKIAEHLLKCGAFTNVGISVNPKKFDNLLRDLYSKWRYNHMWSSIRKNILLSKTCLHIAVLNRDPIMTKLLLRYGAKINDDLTFFHITRLAMEINCEEIIRVLLDHNANFQCIDKKGKSVIHLAVENNHVEIIRSLAHTNINFNSISNDGNSPLHIAVQKGSFHMTKNLIKYGVDVNILNKTNHTVLQNALEYIPISSSNNCDGIMKNTIRDVSKVHYGFTTNQNSYIKIIKILKKQIVKLKIAGLEINKQNLIIVYPPDDYISEKFFVHSRLNYAIDVSQLELKCKQEIEKMKIENIGVSNVTLYDLLKKTVLTLSRFVGNKKIQETLEQDVYDEKFPLYIDIVRNRFRDAAIRYKLMKLVKEYFRINIRPQLIDDCVDLVLDYLTIKEMEMFIRNINLNIMHSPWKKSIY